MAKIKTFNEIKKRIYSLKSKKKKIVHCHGVFDLLHVGHIKHFQEAKTFGDILIITITPDEYVNKGPGRPAFNSSLRLEAIAALEAVDYVILNKWPTATKAIKIICPDIYCKGPDYKVYTDDITGKILEEENAVKSIGGILKTTEEITFSSSFLLNKFGNIYNENQKSFIKKLINEKKSKNFNQDIDKLKKLKVLIVGEAIIDQYVFCEALGKSGKEPVLVLRNLSMDQYAGGAIAIARHLSDFCRKVTLMTMIGEEKKYKDYIEKTIPENVDARYIFKEGAPTIVKRRYVDYLSKSKNLGVYSINDAPLNDRNEKELNKYLDDLLPNYDMVIVSDYGHGFISKDIAKKISSHSKFVSLNAQINAANIGYHMMNNYKGINCIIINEAELRHELRDRETDIDTLMIKLTIKLKSKFLIVTQGSSGAKLYSNDEDSFYECPAFAAEVVDKIGSGDAMLALLSCSLKVGLGSNLSLFLGSLAAAQSVESIGNSKPVSKTKLLKTFKHITK